MRNIFWLCLIFVNFAAQAQKFGYIDSEAILNKMTEYGKAKKELDDASARWQKEIEEMKAKLDQMKAQYESEEVLLTEEMKKERKDTLAARDKALREYQNKIFGYEGLLFLKRQELIKPIQDKLYAAVEKVAKERSLQVIFDKASDITMIYMDPKHDYTDIVLEKLGLGDPNDTIDNERYKGNKNR